MSCTSYLSANAGGPRVSKVPKTVVTIVTGKPYYDIHRKCRKCWLTTKSLAKLKSAKNFSCETIVMPNNNLATQRNIHSITARIMYSYLHCVFTLCEEKSIPFGDFRSVWLSLFTNRRIYRLTYKPYEKVLHFTSCLWIWFIGAINVFLSYELNKIWCGCDWNGVFWSIFHFKLFIFLVFFIFCMKLLTLYITFSEF